MSGAPSSWRRRIAPAARAALTLLLLALVLRDVDARHLAELLAHTELGWLGLGLLTWGLDRWVMAVQMRGCLEALGIRIGVAPLIRINLIAMFYSVLLPGDLAGGAATWYRISRGPGTGVAAGVVLLYLRLVGLATLLVVGFIGLALDPERPFAGFGVAFGLLLALLAAPALPFLSESLARPTDRLFQRIVRWRRCPAWLASRASRLEAALRALRLQSRSARLATVLLGFASHGLGTALVFCLSLAVGVQVPLAALLWIRAWLFVAQMLPITVAGLGVREASLVVMLAPYGNSTASSLSLALLIFAVVLLSAVTGAILQASGSDSELQGPADHRRPASSLEGPGSPPPRPPRRALAQAFGSARRSKTSSLQPVGTSALSRRRRPKPRA